MAKRETLRCETARWLRSSQPPMHTPPDTDLLLMNADTRLRGPLTRTREVLQRPGVAAVSPTVRDAAALLGVDGAEEAADVGLRRLKHRTIVGPFAFPHAAQ